MFNTLAWLVMTLVVLAFVGYVASRPGAGMPGASITQRFAQLRTVVDAGVITLAQAQINTQPDIDYAVIDNLRRYSWLLDQIAFDDTVTPGTGGAVLTYGYTRLTQAAPAGFREFNKEFVPGEAKRERKTADLKPLGGAFNLDRDLADLGPAGTTELAFQMQQLLVSVPGRFMQEMILGDIGTDPTGFDGISKALVGSTTEMNAGALIGSNDWTPNAVNSQNTANMRFDEVDLWLSSVVPSKVGGGDQGAPGALPAGVKAILGNTVGITRMRSLARWAGMYTQTKDDLGRMIERYGDWVLVDIGDLYDGSGPIIPITGGGLTDLFAVTFGLDGFHGASKAGVPLVRTWMPDWSTAGAVKTGEVQMGPVTGVLKNTKACAVLRGVKVR